MGDLRVGVTGPTGEIGRSLVRALDRSKDVGRIVGMARRPFDPGAEGLKKVEYRRGDILDRASVDSLAADVDVLVHLAFIIFGDKAESRRINLQGSRNVFEAALEAGVERLVYTSSVAAYGFHDDNPDWLTEDIEPRGSDEHHYSAQKAEVEELLANLASATGRSTGVYIFRPCIVAGPNALMLIKKIPYVSIGRKLPDGARKVVGALPLLRPVLPDPGVPFQLVHHDDVASAMVAGVLGSGQPGPYNLAANGEITISDLAHALGWYAVPVAELLLDATAKIVSTLPLMPVEARWINALTVPVLADCERARVQLGWKPKHDALETLSQTVAAARAQGLLSAKEKSLAAGTT
ncbi:MAG: NAD-dependent epimerase/dehydratase family protein [Actinomycetota bacterium]